MEAQIGIKFVHSEGWRQCDQDPNIAKEGVGWSQPFCDFGTDHLEMTTIPSEIERAVFEGPW